MTEMLRYNQGKSNISLTPSCFLLTLMSGDKTLNLRTKNFIIGVTEVLEFGAKKYTRENWRQSGLWSVTLDSLLRHWFLGWMVGEKNDAESNLSHLTHIGCNLAFLLEFQWSGMGTDNRFSIPPLAWEKFHALDNLEDNIETEITSMLLLWRDGGSYEDLQNLTLLVSTLYNRTYDEKLS